MDNKELAVMIEKVFAARLDGFEKKLDLINEHLTNNHDRLEERVSCNETEVASVKADVAQMMSDVASVKERKPVEGFNAWNEVRKSLVHWTVPFLLVGAIYLIQSGKTP